MSSEDKDIPQNTQDLTIFVQTLLQQMVMINFVMFLSQYLEFKSEEVKFLTWSGEQQQRFQDMSDAIIQRSQLIFFIIFIYVEFLTFHFW